MSNTKQTNLNRDDVLALLEQASSMKQNAISTMLSLFSSKLHEKVRFASLWKYNKCSKSISIYARSDKDYFPQLGPQGKNLQEFICDADCRTISSLISSPEFLNRERLDCSVPNLASDCVFHPTEVVDRVGLDEFVFLPIDAEHAPSGLDEPPRFFCLLYCRPGVKASNVHIRDLELIQRCLGNMIFNTFSAQRQDIIKKLTNYLAESHDSGNERVLEYLRTSCIPSAAAFQLTVQSLKNNKLSIIPASGNSADISEETALHIWNAMEDTEGAAIIPAEHLPEKCSATSALIWQRKTENARERTMHIFFNKISNCPLHGQGAEPTGKKTFVDHFGFDDRELLEEIGAHIRAFTETFAEKQRRDNNSRIVSHESSQPFFDILSLLSKHRLHASHFPWAETIDRIEDAARLGHAMVEMNTELTDSKLKRMTLDGSTSYILRYELLRLRRSLRRVCEDARFTNDSIQIDVSAACRSLSINMSIVTTIFINTVTNSIKYSDRSNSNSWCNFSVQRMYSSDDFDWTKMNTPTKYRRKGILFTTTDNGVGIPDQFKERVFEQEFQVDNRRAARGLGLGLWHLKRVAMALDGDIWIQSGSDFPDGVQDKTRVSVLLPMKW